MEKVVEFVGPTHALQLFGIKLVGINAENGAKLLFTIVLIAVAYLLGKGLGALTRSATTPGNRASFWTRQAGHVFIAVVVIVGLASIWFDDPARLTTAVGLISAGLAFALQRVVTSVAGYLLVLRGRTFSVGDRIVMGGVRGDVIALGFLQTTIMEMGQPPAVQSADPAVWVRSRQYTGRIVTVSNAMIFDEPVFNYTTEFPYIWEEMVVPISFKDDRRKAEQILLEAAEALTMQTAQLSEEALQNLEKRYAVKRADMKPRVFLRITDNWVELTVRFIVEDHSVRELKDAMSRRILDALDASGIGIASGTYEIVGVPPIRIEQAK